MSSLTRAARALCLLAPAALSGCAVISYIAAQLSGPAKVPQKFALPQDKRTLVLVDSRGGSEMVKRLVTKVLNKELIGRDLVDKVVPYNEIVALRMATPEFNRLRVSQIGEKLKAQTVIHVHITRFALKDNPQDVMWHGQVEARVKVVGVPDERLWPRDRPTGFLVGPITRDETVDLSRIYASVLTKVLGVQLADAVAKLFYEHEAKGIEAWGGTPTGGSAAPQ